MATWVIKRADRPTGRMFHHDLDQDVQHPEMVELYYFRRNLQEDPKICGRNPVDYRVLVDNVISPEWAWVGDTVIMEGHPFVILNPVTE